MLVQKITKKIQQFSLTNFPYAGRAQLTNPVLQVFIGFWANASIFLLKKSPSTLKGSVGTLYGEVRRIVEGSHLWHLMLGAMFV